MAETRQTDTVAVRQCHTGWVYCVTVTVAPCGGKVGTLETHRKQERSLRNSIE